ncbi:hypothetical protein [Variovorax paradoxus]|uniref:hypothetical protein n=1 Tax=Variovorax paradoxus TaxID=34073 RepID=UPI0019329E4A|nr:hypothetical protein INQ48_13685 [Variovorax paradoxus]
MATLDPNSLPDAVEMLRNQHLSARDFVMETLKIPVNREDFAMVLVGVLQVLATNELTLAQKKAKAK